MAVVATGQGHARQRSDHAVAGSPADAPTRALDVLFIMRSLTGYLRFFRSSLELIVERGHNVRLLLDRGDHGDPEQRWLERMLERPNFACEIVDHFGRERWVRLRVAIRQGIEYVRVLRAGTEKSTEHFRHRLRHVPARVRRLTEMPLIRTRGGLAVLHGILSALDRTLPAPAAAAEYVEALRPDVVALSDHGNVGSLHSAYAKAAKELGIPVAMCVATWDNLSSRQRTRVVPDLLVVWNQRQVQEAVEIHGVPAERVALTGAQSFDDWFSWKPRPRSEFLARVGLDPARPVILWVGGALYRSDLTEAEYAADWLAALRSAGDPVLREAGVLLRPHPCRVKQWLRVDFSDFDNAVVFPSDSGFPTEDEAKSDYFDSIYHAGAVVGLNTSAMIEASIVGRPVLTVLAPEFHHSQLGTFHFSYLLESSGGAVRVAHSIEEQFVELSGILAGRDSDARERSRRFVADFVRPHGLDRPATPIFVETLEQLAETPVQPERDSLWVRAVRRLLVLALWLADHGVRRPRGLGRRIRTFRRSAVRVWRRVVRAFVKRAARVWRPPAVRAVVKRVRRFFLVGLRAAVRVRLERMRSLVARPEPAESSTSAAPARTSASGGPWRQTDGANVCHCRAVAYATVEKAIAGGARTVADLQRGTTACTRCFGCRSELERMLRLHLGDAYHHEPTVTLPPEFARTQPPRTMFMPVLAGFRGAPVDTRVIAFNWEGPEKAVPLRADLLRPDGKRVHVWRQEVPYGCSAVLDVDRAAVGSLLPEGVGVLKLVLDTDEIGSLRPYFQFVTPTCITSTHEKKGPSKRGHRTERPYHWIFPVGVGKRDEEAYFFCTNVQMNPMAGELVWTSDDGQTASAPIPTLELDQTACVALHEHFDDVRTGARGGSVRLSPATHVVAGFMIRHDRERQLWRVQHL